MFLNYIKCFVVVFGDWTPSCKHLCEILFFFYEFFMKESIWIPRPGSDLFSVWCCWRLVLTSLVQGRTFISSSWLPVKYIVYKQSEFIKPFLNGNDCNKLFTRIFTLIGSNIMTTVLILCCCLYVSLEATSVVTCKPSDYSPSSLTAVLKKPHKRLIIIMICVCCRFRPPVFPRRTTSW